MSERKTEHDTSDPYCVSRNFGEDTWWNARCPICRPIPSGDAA